MAIDCHAHWIPDELAELLRIRSAAPRIKATAHGEVFVTWHGRRPLAPLLGSHERLAGMDRDGVTLQLLSLAPLFGIDCLPLEDALPLVRAFNDGTARLGRRFPDRFAGLAALPVADMQAAAQELRRSQALGLRGAVLPADGFVSRVAAERFRPVFAAADELGSHLFIHPGPVVAQTARYVQAQGADHAWQRHIVLQTQATLSECFLTLGCSDFLDAYREVTVQLANLGGTIPFLLERMEAVQLDREGRGGRPISELRRCYVDTASFGLRAVALALECFGEDRVLLGTDCPIFSTARMLAALTGLPAPARTAVLEANAKRVLRLD